MPWHRGVLWDWCPWAGCAHRTRLAVGGGQGRCIWAGQTPLSWGKWGSPGLQPGVPCWWAVFQGIAALTDNMTTTVHGRRVVGCCFWAQGGRTDCDRSAPSPRHFPWGQGHSCSWGSTVKCCRPWVQQHDRRRRGSGWSARHPGTTSDYLFPLGVGYQLPNSMVLSPPGLCQFSWSLRNKEVFIREFPIQGFGDFMWKQC